MRADQHSTTVENVRCPVRSLGLLSTQGGRRKPPLLPTLERPLLGGERRYGHIQSVNKPARLVIEFNVTLQLLAQRRDHSRSETLARRLGHRRTAGLGPFEAKTGILSSPANMNLSRRKGQGSELCRVGAKLVQGHRECNDRTRRNPYILAGNDEAGTTLVERFDGAADSAVDCCVFPTRTREKIVGARQCRKAPVNRRPCVGHAGRGAQALIRDRADGREHILDPVMQLGVNKGLQLSSNVAFLSLDARLDQ